MLLSSPCCYQALRVKTSKLQSLIQISKPLGQALLLEITSPWSSSVGLALLSSSATTLRKENPCSFPWEFASHYTIDFWDLIFTVSLHSPLKLSCLWARQRGWIASEKVMHEVSETCCQKPTPLMGSKRIVFHFAVHSAESQSFRLPGKLPSLLQHFLLVTINKFKILICCNKVISSCTLPVRDLVQQSLLSAHSHSFSLTASPSSDPGGCSVSWWQRVFERIYLTHTNPIAPLPWTPCNCIQVGRWRNLFPLGIKIKAKLMSRISWSGLNPFSSNSPLLHFHYSHKQIHAQFDLFTQAEETSVWVLSSWLEASVPEFPSDAFRQGRVHKWDVQLSSSGSTDSMKPCWLTSVLLPPQLFRGNFKDKNI